MSAPCLGTRAHPRPPGPRPSLDKAPTSFRTVWGSPWLCVQVGQGDTPAGRPPAPHCIQNDNRESPH